MLLHSCPGALALASGPFFLLPPLGWMPLMASATNPSPGRPHSRPHPTPFCDVSHGLALQKALSKYLPMKRFHPPLTPIPQQDQSPGGGLPGVHLVPPPLQWAGWVLSLCFHFCTDKAGVTSPNRARLMSAQWVMRNQGAADTTPTGADGRPKALGLGVLWTLLTAHSPLRLLWEAPGRWRVSLCQQLTALPAWLAYTPHPGILALNAPWWGGRRCYLLPVQLMGQPQVLLRLAPARLVQLRGAGRRQELPSLGLFLSGPTPRERSD